MFTGEHDERDAICEVHAGEGGTDAQDWAEMALRMYLRWAERRGFATEIDELSAGREAGILSATFLVKGRYAYGMLRGEQGVHRLVRMSPFDAASRRQTSFASLDVTPFLEDVSDEVVIDEKDLRTGLTTGNVEAVLDGDLDEFIESVLRWERGGRAE